MDMGFGKVAQTDKARIGQLKNLSEEPQIKSKQASKKDRTLHNVLSFSDVIFWNPYIS